MSILESENSRRRRLTGSLHDNELKSYKNEEDIEPDGQGGIPFQEKKREAQKLSQQERRLERDDAAAQNTIDQCSKKIEELQQKYAYLENRL